MTQPHRTDELSAYLDSLPTDKPQQTARRATPERRVTPGDSLAGYLDHLDSQPAPVKKAERTTLEAAKDLGLGTAAGVVQGVGMVANAFGADNDVARGADALAQDLIDSQSEQRKAQRSARAAEIRRAEASGSAWEEIKANVGAFLEAPAETALNALGTSAPTLLMSFIPGLGQANAARLILQGAVGAAQGAGSVKGSIYEAVERKLVENGHSQDDAAKVAAGAQAYDSQNAGQIALGALLHAVGGSTGIERSAARMLSREGGEAAARGIAGRTAMGVVKEAPVEGVQGGQERLAANLALQNQGFEQPTWQGVAGQAAGEAVASVVPGGVFGALEPSNPVAAKATEPHSPLSRAAVAANPDLATPANATATPANPEPDPLSQRAAEIAARVRSEGLLDRLREIGQPGRTVTEFLDAMALAQNGQADPAVRAQALESLEQALGWIDDGRMPGDPATGRPFSSALTVPPAEPEPGSALAPRQDGPLTSAGQPEFFDPNTVDVDAVRVDNMLPGPRALPGPTTALEEITAHVPEPAQAGEEAVAPQGPQAAPAGQPDAEPAAAQPVARRQVQPPKVATPRGEGPAQRRQRMAQLAAMAADTFDTVERRADGFWMVSFGRNEEMRLDGPGDAQRARAAIDDAFARAAKKAEGLGDMRSAPPAQINGMTVRLEYPKGSQRSGTSPDGAAWTRTMAAHYGRIQGIQGADGMPMDAFIGDAPSSPKIYVVDQLGSDGSFDEHKVVTGVRDEAHARQTYLANYPEGWTGLGAITPMGAAEFKAWARSDAALRPASPTIAPKEVSDEGRQGSAGAAAAGADQAAGAGDRGARGAALRDAGAALQGRAAAAARRTEQDAAAVERLAQEEDDTSLRLAGSTPEANALRALLAAAEQAFGVRGIAIESELDRWDGVEHGGQIFVNVLKPHMHVAQTIGHELAHTQEGVLPVLRERLWAMLSEEGRRAYFEGYLFKKEGLQYDQATAAQLAKLKSEMLADFFGQRLQDRAWLTQLGQQKPALFAAFVRDWLAMLDHLVATLKSLAGRMHPRSVKNVDRYIAELEQAKAIAIEVVAEWAQRHRRLAEQAGLAEAVQRSVREEADLFQEDFADKATQVDTGIAVSSRGATLKGGNVDGADRQIASTRQGLENFWRWFGASVASDDKRRPMRLYHSTNGDFGAFESGRKTSNNYGFLGDVDVVRSGIFLTPDLAFSEEYLREGDGQNVMPVYLSLQNPLDLRRGLDEAQEAELIEAGINSRWLHGDVKDWERFDNDEEGGNFFVETLKRLGYDGAIIVEQDRQGEPHDTYVAFEPSQIKSATGNRGSFSAADPDIRYSERRQDPADGDRTDVSKLPRGRPVPESAGAGGLEASMELARAGSFRRGRDLKLALQQRVREAAAAAGIDLTARTQANHRFLAGMLQRDARHALQSNANAVGWYDKRVSRALGALATIHPEIETDPRSRLAFLWALAVTSNGLKVNKNFELAERAYRGWKADGVMPTDIGIGTAAGQINSGLAMFNELSAKLGAERLAKFMSTEFTVGEIERMLGMKISGEWANTPVRGAAVLGPKIGNGFFSNLNGYFDALTMDRWLMRSWGRLTGTLIEVDEQKVAAARKAFSAAVDALSESERRVFARLVGAPVRKRMTRAEIDQAAEAIDRVSMKKDQREAMQSTPAMNRLRLDGRNLAKAIDGQKEAPAGPAERNWIRAAAQASLEGLRDSGLDMTMADQQALLWYPERRLYDVAKSEEDVADGYEDDEAPDYANAAMALALQNDVPLDRLMAAMDAAEALGARRGAALSATEKQAMLDEFRAPPAQAFQLAYEVAPDPADVALVQAWEALPVARRGEITSQVKDAVLDDIASLAGVEIKKTVSATGGYAGHANPNLISEYQKTRVSIEQARGLAAAIGFVLDQDSVALVDERARDTAGLIRVTFSGKVEKHAQAVFAAIRAAVPEVDAFTARGNNFDILNFTGMPDVELDGRIVEALQGVDLPLEFVTSFGGVRTELVEKGSYEGLFQGVRPGSGSEIRTGVEWLRDRARQIVAAGIRAGADARGPGRAAAARLDDGAAPSRHSERDQGPASRADARAVRYSGRVRGGAGLLADERRPYQGDGRQGFDLEGLPQSVKVDGQDIRFHGFKPAQQAARRYMAQAGLPYDPPRTYAQVDPERARRIAAAFDAMPHNPQDPEVKAAYAALIRETEAQYEAMLEAGVRVEFNDGGDPYGSPRHAILDVVENNHLYIFSTRDGFGTGELDVSDNPLLAETRFKFGDQVALANDLFRAVHDYFGHVAYGVGFRADGEENTWRAHAAMFSPLARRALTTETRGQNSWVNFGPHAEFNRQANGADTQYAPQKVGLLPEWVSEEGRPDAPKLSARVQYEVERDEDDEGTFVFARDAERKDQAGGQLVVGHLHVPDEAVRNGEWRIGDIYVDAGLRRQRIASQMIEAMSRHLGGQLAGATSVFSPDGKALFDAVSSGARYSARDATDDYLAARNKTLTQVTPQSVLDADIDLATKALEAVMKDIAAGRYQQMTVPIGSVPHVLRMLTAPTQMMKVDTGIVRKILVDKHSEDFAGASAREFVMAMYRPALVLKGEAAGEYELVSSLLTPNGPIMFVVKQDAMLPGDKVRVATIMSAYARPVGGNGNTIAKRILAGKLLYADMLTAQQAVTGQKERSQSQWTGFGNSETLQDGSAQAGHNSSQLPIGPVSGETVQNANDLVKPLNARYAGWRALSGKILGDIAAKKVKTDVELMAWIAKHHQGDWDDVPAFSLRDLRDEADPQDNGFYADLRQRLAEQLDGARGGRIFPGALLVDALAGQAAPRHGDIRAGGHGPHPDANAVIAWAGQPEFLGEYLTAGGWGRDRTGRRGFMFAAVPAHLVREGAGVADIAREFGAGNVIFGAQIIPREDGSADVQISGPAEGSAVAREFADQIERTGRPNAEGQEYLRIRLGQALTQSLLREAARRFAITNDGRLPALRFVRETGAKPGDQVRLIDGPRAEARFSARDPGSLFFSELARQVQASSMKQAPAGAWKAFIKALTQKGVKADEIEWSGILEWMDLQDGKVGRDALLAFLAGHGVRVEEVVLGRDGKPNNDEWEPDDGRIGNTRYGNYTLPGGENYREILLTLPPMASDSEIMVAAMRLHEARGGEKKGYDAPRGVPEARRMFGAALDDLVGKNYRSSHWEQPNVLAHIRVNDRVDADGARVLFIEELQSDWGQEGKKSGFGSPAPKVRPGEYDALMARIRDGAIAKFVAGGIPRDQAESAVDVITHDAKAKLAGMTAEFDDLMSRMEDDRLAQRMVPAAPFVAKTDGWLNLALKRVIGLAVDGGYDKLAFVTGEQSAERYDLSKHISRVEYEPISADDGKAGVYEVIAYGMKGEELFNEDEIGIDRVEDVLGKEVAKKMAAREGKRSSGGYRDWHALSGLDLKVGGEGMKAFYDQIVPSAVKALLKKFGGDGMTVSRIQFKDGTEKLTREQPAIDITRALREKVGDGLPLFSLRSDWDAPQASRFDDFVYKAQNKMVDVKRVVESIAKSVGQIADDLNVYLQEELFHGRAAKRVQDFGQGELQPLLKAMAEQGLAIGDVEEYLHARHAREANALIAGREPGLPDGGSGMTDAAADAYFAKLDAATRQKLEGAAAQVDAILARTRQLYADYGLESQDQVDGWAQMFQHYVPLQREDKGQGMGIGQGFSVKGKEVRGRTGSTRKVVDILGNIAMQRERVIVRGEKNRVAAALVGLASAHPNAEFWTVGRPPSERVYDPKTNSVVERLDPMFKSRENVVVAKIRDGNGQIDERAVVFNEDDPRALRMAQALKNLDAGNLEGLLGISAKITRYFAAVNTQYNPVFGVVNLVRDVQGAMVNLGATPLAGQQARIARDTLSALRGIYGDVRAARRGGQPASAWAQLWDEFQREGGQTGFRELFKTGADRAQQLQKILTPDGWMDSKLGRFFTAGGMLRKPMGEARKGAGWLFDWLSDYNEAMENGVRLASYKAAVDQGMSKKQAASLAKNLTVNFNRRGQLGQQAGAVYAFFNAAMQGSARIGQTLLEMDGGQLKTLRLSRTGKAVVYGGMLLGSVQALMLAAAGFDEEDPPEFVRERSLVIPTGGKTYVSIPMPLGLHVIPGLGRHAVEFALSGFAKPAHRFASVFGMVADAFNPIGNAGLSMQTLAPTALDPLVALTENRDWTGKPIARTSSNRALPGHQQWKDTATWVGKSVAEAINTLSGGNQYVAGVLSPTPDQIDYLIAQATGGVGRELSKLEQTGFGLVRGEAIPTHKIPLVGRFIGNAASQASEAGAFYGHVNRLNELETEVKGLRKDGRHAEARTLLHTRPEAYLMTQANAAERQIQRLRREKRALVEQGAGREQVAAKEAQITATMARLNRAVDRLRDGAS